MIVQIQTWNDVKNDVKKINPDLYDAIDVCSPPDEMKIKRCQLPFGYVLGDNKYYYSPQEDGTVKNENGMLFPFGIILDKCVEVYMQDTDRTIPRNIYEKGEIFPKTVTFMKESEYKDIGHTFSPFTSIVGTFNNIYLPFQQKGTGVYDILTDIGETKRYSLDSAYEQACLIRRISNHLNPKWHAEILLFEDKWIYSIANDHKYLPIRYYILKESSYLQSSMNMFFYMRYSIGDIEKKTNLPIGSMSLDIFKNIILTLTGLNSGFSPTENETYLPYSTLRDYLESTYKSKTAPLFVNPSMCRPNKPIYISMNTANNVVENLKTRRATTFLADLKKYYPHMLEYFTTHIATKSDYFETLRDKLKLKFYSQYGITKQDIQPFSKVAIDDKRFSNLYKPYKEQYQFPAKSLFSKALISAYIEK